MFSLASIAPVKYEDPWNLPLRDRVRSLARGRQRVAYFYEKADNSTFRYRVYNMVHVLNSGGNATSAAYFFLADLHRLEEIAELADVLVICRTRYDHRVNHLVGAFRRRGKRVLFDTDDLVFNTEYAHLLVKTLDLDITNPQVWDDWFAYTSRLGATLKLCDGAVTTNDYLAAQIAGFAGVPTAVVPNFINPEQLELSDRVFEAKRALSPLANDEIHLGYFSGSPSHNRDFAMVSAALEEALEEDPRLAVVVVGYIEAGPGLTRFGNRVVRFPFHDWVNLQRLVGAVEFNLMPLQHNVFTHCKSELKYFEAAVVGTQSIASPTYTYARAIRHGHNGYLAQAHQWLSAIRQAVSDLERYQSVAERTRTDAREKYAWFNQRACVFAALGLEDLTA
ncbi:MAG TPA: glycosyltransferase family 1 protein [Ramlibacter sp.]